MDSMGSAQNQQPEQIILQQPEVQPTSLPWQTKIGKFLSVGTWIILFALAPLTVLIFLSQDSIPGDTFYPVKRGMENVILAAASVNPVTRAAFSTDLTTARFKEAQSLVISKSNASGLATFIDDVQSVQLEVANLKDDTQRTKAEEKLISKLEEYQTGLSTLETKTEQKIITYQALEIPALTSIPPTSAANLPTATPPPAGGFTPTLISTSTPTSLPSPSSQPKSSPAPTPTHAPILSPLPSQTSILMPTPTPMLTLIPTVVQTAPTVPLQPENTQVAEQKKIAITIKETKTTLEKIKKDLEEKHEKGSENQNKNSPDKKAESTSRQK